MSKPLRISFIKQYILDKPNRSFEEVVAFAEEIGANEDELEEAILSVAETQQLPTTHAPLSKPETKKLYRKLFQKKYMVIATVFGLFVLMTSLISLIRPHKAENLQTVMETALAKPLEKLSQQQVYANQITVNADKVFSYPASDISLPNTGLPKKKVIGFLPYWMSKHTSDISLTGLTAINLFGLESDGNGNIVITHGIDPDGGWEMWNDPTVNQFITRTKQRKIKVLLTIKSFNNQAIEHLVQSDDAQKRFISNAVQLMQTKSLDGINIDFEYVGTASDTVKDGFVRFIANLNSELKRENDKSQLTVDTYIISGASSSFFEISLLQDSVDAFIVMGYDIHTPKGSPGPIAPLEGEGSIVGYMQSYLDRVPADKLILGVPYYGYAWSTNGEGTQTLPYAEIAAMTKKLKIKWDGLANTPYVTYTSPEDSQTYTLHYENARSLGLKYDFVNQKDLAGVAIWALGYDGLNKELQQVLLDKFSK
jgi:spore germination protein YaaH